MHQNLRKMSYLDVAIFFCLMVTFMVNNCETTSENSSKAANLSKFLSELDLSTVEASIENEESTRKIVKRLAPEKNVFFGNADLLKEWLKGAGVTGQPGVDFPALTTIPATSFSCRGLKGGYYADLETNCQVFHICDNGRKISFLCPNGTIFQQSQLICDWWFKVDCSKSAELYEQSSEQLLEEQRRRAESRKSKVDYQRPIESGGQQDYYDVQSLNYDGKQNGRIKPYQEPPQENQLQPNRERIKPSRHFEPGNNFNQESNRDSNQLFGGNGPFQSNQSPNVKQPFNQFTRNTEEGSVNRYSTVGQDYYGTSKKSQSYHATNRNVNTLRDEKGSLKRSKFKGSTRNNSSSTASQRVTPTYTESTTFRASNSNPIKESQQFAESAAFVGNRGNRFNENSNHQYYYQLYVNRDTATRNPNYDSTSPTARRQSNDNDVSTQRNDFVPFTDATSASYETTTQYTVTTVTPSCNDEITTESPGPTNPWTNFDSQPTTESLQFANSNYEYRGRVKNTASVRNSFTEHSSYGNSNNNEGANRPTNANSNSETIPPTTRSYATASAHRQTAATPDSNEQRRTTDYLSPTPTVSFRSNNFGTVTDRPVTRNSVDNRSNKSYGDSKDTDKRSSTVSSGYRSNLISSTTEKPSRTTSVFQQGSPTEKDLSPYDRSFTYKQGKVMSTLGPYVPFTRNYAYSATSTTAKPTPYTPTVPTTYTTARSSSKTLSPKLKYPAPTSLSKIKSSSVRFSEREHALSMLHSLRNLESNVPSLSQALNGSHRAYNVSAAPAPSTLHSLALYFSTATENFDSNEATDSSLSVESAEDVEESMLSKKSNGTVEVPTSLLTRHTIDSYAELFKLNDAIETGNATTEDRVDDASIYGEDYNEDLELQQSGGSLDDLRKSNSTRLRELAQVFTHALSAYLLDPDAFKKVLTEIRPTEPSLTTVEGEQWTTPTSYPIIDEDNVLTAREKDEVLDFSDDGNNVRQKLTTIYPTTFETPTTTRDSVYDIFSTVPSTYYSTPRTSTRDAFELSTNYVSFDPATSPHSDASVPPTASVYTVEQSSTPYANDASGFYGQNNEIDKGNSGIPTTDSYAPSGESGNRNRVGGFQNNSVTIITEPYGNEKLSITTPLSDSYLVSPTPSSPSVFVHMATYNWNRKSTSKKPEQQLSPPFYENYPETSRKSNGKTPGYLNPESYASTPMSAHSVRSTTLDSGKTHEIPIDQPRKVPRNKSPLSDSKRSGISSPISKNSYVKFRNHYNRVDEHNIGTTERSTTTTSAATESTTSTSIADTTPCADINSNDSTESTNQKDESKASNNDHWTSSPVVTRLWETSVFVDPRKINHGLEGDLGTTISAESYGGTDNHERLEYGNTPSSNEDRFGSSEESYISDEGIPAAAQRLSRDKDSPTTFSLLPASFVAEESATPKPLITTRSSITTTITSSITSTNSLPQETLVTSLLPNAIPTTDKLNDTENEIAEKLFGKLNVSSTNALMKVMKQADSNETVRQLVLLLIRHCNDPANKTMHQEKDELLNALLRLPVNEFPSGESRSVVAGIDQVNSPAGRSVGSARSVPVASVATEPPVTTFRSRKSRKFRTTTEHSANIARRSEKGVGSSGIKSLQEGETFASDNRALELLRSLYTIATKWG